MVPNQIVLESRAGPKKQIEESGVARAVSRWFLEWRASMQVVTWWAPARRFSAWGINRVGAHALGGRRVLPPAQEMLRRLVPDCLC